MDELRAEMFQVTVGYWLSKALFCAAKAGVADQLEAGPKHIDEIASDAEVNAENLYRVLRALASVGIFEEGEPGVMSLTPKAEYLRGDHPQSMKHFALMVGDDLFDVWCDLDHAVETGRSAVEKRFGRDFFSEIANDLQKSAIFDRAMQEIHGGETQLMLGYYDFTRHSKVLDVGGGNGSTLREILQAHEHLRGALFDLPQVVDHARRALAGSDVVGRIELMPGDFFVEVPGKADCIILRHVLHDWSDDQSKTILQHSAKALADGGSILIVEKVIRPGNEPSFVKLLDLNMMAIGGKERTEAQYRKLLDAAGMRLHEIHETPGPIDLIEARR